MPSAPLRFSELGDHRQLTGLGCASVGKPEHSGVLKKLTNNACDPNIFTQGFFAWVEAAHASNDQVDFDACLGCFVEQGDDVGINQGIHLGFDLSLTTMLGVLDLTPDQCLRALS